MLTYIGNLLGLLRKKFMAFISIVLGSSNFSKATAKAPSKSSHTFAWTIENFGTRYIRRGTDVRQVLSPIFQAKHPDGTSSTSWQAEIQVVGDRTIKAYLNLRSCPAEYLEGNGLLTIYSISFGTPLFPRWYGCEATREFKAIGSGHGWGDFLTVSELRHAWLLPSDTLRVRVNLTTFSPPEPPSSATVNEFTSGAAEDIVDEEEASAALDFKFNFEFLLGNENFSDIKIQCGPHSIFPAHKSILSARSEVFKVLLGSDMEEVKSGVINVTDMTPTVFGILLRYMYTGKVDPALDSDSLLEIIYGAEKYGLKELKNYCFAKLVKFICEENVGTLAVAAHLYAAEEKVKTVVSKFIEPNFLKLMKRKEFRGLVAKHGDAFLTET